MKRSWFVLAALAAVAPICASAQSQLYPHWEIPGFDFSKDGAFRKWARAVAERRAALLAARDYTGLNAALARGVAPRPDAAIAGTVKVPAVLFEFKNTVLGLGRDTSDYTNVLYGASPPLSRPYTVRTFYEEMSNGLLSIQGNAIGYAILDSNEVTYTGAPPCTGNPTGNSNCNGLFKFSGGQTGPSPLTRMQRALREALRKVDSMIAPDWSQYDYDASTGILNLVIFVQPAKDGACGGSGNNHLWSHRFELVNTPVTLDSPYVTKTSWPGHAGQFLRIQDYTLQSGVGGSAACDSTKIMAIGTAAHETGHAFGLPDLYDNSNTEPGEGIGEWGLMGSGNYTSSDSPSRMEAWSLSQLGWVTVAPITTDSTYSFGPAPTSDTAWMIRPTGSNPRGEYYLLENRQAVQSDTALIRLHGGGGLLLWHVDSAKLAQAGLSGSNQVNVGLPQGLLLEQADGFGDLQSGANRGDAGDPYPGASNNTVFSYSTNPANVKNSDGTFAGFAVDSIKQLSANGPMSFRVQFGGFSLVRASDSSATVQFDSVNYNVFRGLLANASSHEVGVADTQFTNSGRNRFRYQSWSDGLARVHPITGTFAGDTLIATLAKDFQTQVTKVGTGSIAQSPAPDATGFVSAGAPDTLIAAAGGGFAFDGWTGDTTAVKDTLVLPMARPFNVTATFSPTLVISSGATRPDGVMGAPYSDALAVTGGNGTNHWHVVGGALPNGVTLALNGTLAGSPKQTGNFSYTARDTSGQQVSQGTFGFSVTAPTLLTADVVSQVLTGFSALTANQLTYLDYLGNNNGSVDVGDFLAWVNATGAPLAAPPPAATSRRPSKRGGRP